MKVGLIGAGNMARALARGWGEPVLCSDSRGGSGSAAALVAELGGHAGSNVAVAREADLVVLCHKPYQLDAVAAEIAGDVRALVSVLGATPVVKLAAAYPGAQVLRIEPNTAVEVGAGVLLHALPAEDDAPVDAAWRDEVLARFGRLGMVADVPEATLGAAAAVSAVGPAYLALVAEAWADAAIRHGVAPELAGRLATETMAGTAALLTARDNDTLAVRRGVTSPGGSTARGLDALERAGVRAAFADAMDAVDTPSRGTGRTQR